MEASTGVNLFCKALKGKKEQLRDEFLNGHVCTESISKSFSYQSYVLKQF